MKPEYKRENLEITEFDTEDIITTSGDPDAPDVLMERENRYGSFNDFDKAAPGPWF